MEQKKEKMKFRLNLFDSVVLVLVLIVGGVFVWQTLRSGASSSMNKNQTVRYTVVMKEVKEGTGDSITIGGRLEDAVKNYDLGTIDSKTILPTEKQVLNHAERSYVTAYLDGYEDVEVEVVVPAVETDSALLIDGSYELRVGDYMYMRGEGYMSSGFVTKIERVD